ncbi:unnamed protein product [Kluyveromyces dobzhanskii CBS 2104]|uniref:WGS project CCBQ000000000 data, contig 00028 n=1 Tax=Kluyveromyces dobzhanskii CBS 2104 TaxID=1427455 RepID=A0A0A8KYT9_9SACH|nr:unnamed protein product [Kluyveromyces dobzhanskii CBS 2104]
MDLIDHEYMISIFPRYLLKQPIGHDLWKLYYQHKKLFHKLKTKDELLTTDLDSSGSVAFQHLKTPNRLNAGTRKEIWEKLSQLGVLGTIPYDSLSDDYLVQVHKYFYSRDDASSTRDVDIDMTKPGITEEDFLGNMLQDSEDDEGEEDPDDEHDPEDDEDVDEGDEEDDDDNLEDVDDHDDEDEEFFLQATREAQEAAIQIEQPDRSSSGFETAMEAQGPVNIENSEVDHNKQKNKIIYYPEAKESKHTVQLKSNPIPGEIYKTLGYPLPHKWLLQSDNSILLSQDGSAILRVNPNWYALSSYGRASPIMNSRLRVNINSKKKQQWATTWANSGVNHTKCAVFYFEIRVLSVTSSQAGRNSHVLVGFKNWAKVNDKVPNPDQTSTDSGLVPPSSHSNMLRNVLDGSRNVLTSPSSPSQTIHGDVETYSYSGLDGNKFDASGSQKFSRPFGNDDVVGCGVNFIEGSIFFTKNGIFLGNAFEDCFDIDLVPFISIKSGNSLRTNFGLTEEFLFDIDQYQLQWKYKTYSHIFKAVDYDSALDMASDESDNEDLRKLGDEIDADHDMDLQEEVMENCEQGTGNIDEDHPDGFLLTRDRRFSGDKLWKPNTPKLNNINSNNDSIPCQLNSMINDYLIHEGYIDVAKGFLKDLQRDCIPNNSDERARFVIRHNERQILKEEQNLQVRQTIRRYIHDGEILKCMKYVEQKFPGLLEKYLELTFEMKCADYLLCLSQQSPENDLIDSILSKGQDISDHFLQNGALPDEMRDSFRERFNEISPLMAYSNPSKECTDDRSFYLSSGYLQERLFQTINSHILQYLDKKSQSSLESMIGYTRAMIATLIENDSCNPRDKEPAYHKLVNIDEDLLKL